MSEALGASTVPALNAERERCGETYGATAAFAGERCEIQRCETAPAASTAGELLCRSRFRVRFREAMTLGPTQSSKQFGEERGKNKRERGDAERKGGTGGLRNSRGPETGF